MVAGAPTPPHARNRPSSVRSGMADLPISFDDVQRAAGVIEGHVRRTPVFSCASLGEGVWLKAELLPRTGAVKGRGAFSRIAELTDEERARGVVTCSAGNQ